MVVRLFFIAALASSLMFMPLFAHAQDFEEDVSASQDLVLAVFLDNELLSPGIFALEKNNRYYLPVIEISDILGFFTEFDVANQSVKGWAIDEDRNFIVDAANNSLVYRDEVFPLPGEAILQDSAIDTEVYVLADVLNEIWPLVFDVNLNALALYIDADETLPFLEIAKRKERRKVILARQNSRKTGDENIYQFIGSPYKLIDKPSFDFNASYGFQAQQQRVVGNANVSGIQDLAFASADYSSNLTYVAGELDRPDNIRLRFTRQRNHRNALPLDLEQIQYGDVNVVNPNLVSNNVRGRGFNLTNSKGNISREFDVITVDGVGVPGYEVELYVNNQLITFSEVDESGIFQFDDVPITYGNNRVRTVLYGPQGQKIENVESYILSSNMVKPGEYRYSAGLVDKDRVLLPVDEIIPSTPTGLSGSAYGAYGFTKNLTGFTTATFIPDNDDGSIDDVTREYVSAGFIRPFKNTLVQVEGLQEIGGGQAVDLRVATSFLGFRMNANAAYFNDFESPEAGIGLNAKDNEIEVDLFKTISTPVGRIGLQAGVERVERVSGTTATAIDTRESFNVFSTRVTNQNRFLLSNGDYTNGNGSISSNTNFRKFRLRNALSYSTFPDARVESFTTSLRYGSTQDVSAGLTSTYNFNSGESITGVQLAKTFEKFIGSGELSYASDNGFGFLVRASTSIGPFAEDGSYMMTSNSLRNVSPVSAFVFRDNDYNGIFNEGDEPEPGTRIRVGRRVPLDETDESGNVSILNAAGIGRLNNIIVEEDSIDDPYLVAGVPKGFTFYSRPGVRHAVALPLVDTGAIDGTLRWLNDGRGIGGLAIQLMDLDGNIIEESVTAQDGYYTFEKIRPGSYTIRANPETGLNIPFERVELTQSDLFKFGTDIDVVDLERGMNVDLDVGLNDDGSLNAKNILSLAKGFKSNGKGLSAPLQPRAKIQKAVQKVQTKKTMQTDNLNFQSNSQKPMVLNAVVRPNAAKMSVLDKISARINQPDAPVNIDMLKVEEGQKATRVMLELGAPVEYSVAYDDASKSIMVEMPFSQWNAQTSWKNPQSSIMSGYFAEPLGGTGTRLIISVNDSVEIAAAGLGQTPNTGKDSLYLDIVKK